jgi:hypothetical protein
MVGSTDAKIVAVVWREVAEPSVILSDPRVSFQFSQPRSQRRVLSVFDSELFVLGK